MNTEGADEDIRSNEGSGSGEYDFLWELLAAGWERRRGPEKLGMGALFGFEPAVKDCA